MQFTAMQTPLSAKFGDISASERPWLESRGSTELTALARHDQDVESASHSLASVLVGDGPVRRCNLWSFASYVATHSQGCRDEEHGAMVWEQTQDLVISIGQALAQDKGLAWQPLVVSDLSMGNITSGTATSSRERNILEHVSTEVRG